MTTTKVNHARRSLIGGTAAVLASLATNNVLSQEFRSFIEPRRAMPDLVNASAWLNGSALRLEDLRGKVVLVQFWTYTCINWLRTLPYVNAWWAKYKDHGLVVIGVHTPEFSFERNLDNVRQATRSLQISYPVAVDSEHGIWDAFRNSAWPSAYLIDASGMIRYRHDGEGEYMRTERVVQRLLAGAGPNIVPDGVVRVDGRGVQAAADWARLRSPETYVGYRQAERLQSPGGSVADRVRHYDRPGSLSVNGWAVSGRWLMTSETIRSEAASASLIYRFQARDVNLVMGTMPGTSPIGFKVRIDGQPPGRAHGVDADENGRGFLSGPRLYQLIRQPGQFRDCLFEIEFLSAGAEVFAFTFG